MTWGEIAENSWDAANNLHSSGYLRSCVSRAYYSAYSYATAALERKGIRFKDGRDGPPHASLPELVIANLELDRKRKYQVRRALVTLYKARVQADYFKQEIGENFVRMALRDASIIRRSLRE